MLICRSTYVLLVVECFLRARISTRSSEIEANRISSVANTPRLGRTSVVTSLVSSRSAGKFLVRVATVLLVPRSRQRKLRYRFLQLQLRVRYMMLLLLLLLPFVPRWSDRRTFLRQQSPRHEPFFGSAGVIVVRVKQRHSGQHHQQTRTSDDDAEEPVRSRFRRRARVRRRYRRRGGRLLR